MLEFWKRKEVTTSLEWGTLGFEQNEHDRPDFRGEKIVSFVDGKDLVFYPSTKRNFFVSVSMLAVFALCCVVVGAVVSIYLVRYQLTKSKDAQVKNNAGTVASILNAVQIQVANAIYSFIANALSEQENHRTATQFEDSMITKIFLFQFINSYASFFYLAFIAQHMVPNDCKSIGDDGNCMINLAYNLGIILGSRLVSGNLVELLVPYLSFQFQYLKEVQSYGGKMNRPEKEFLLTPYDTSSSVLEDYAEVAIQFGYQALFVAALPMASAFALVSNFVEIKGDAWKLLTLHQRPVPLTAEDIGSWQDIFLLISIAAVLTNAGITVFTMSTLDNWSTQNRYWTFILFTWVCFLTQAVVMAAIPDIPESIELHQARAEFLQSKIIDKVEDDSIVGLEGRQFRLEIEEYPDRGGNYAAPTLNLITQNMT